VTKRKFEPQLNKPKRSCYDAEAARIMTIALRSVGFSWDEIATAVGRTPLTARKNYYRPESRKDRRAWREYMAKHLVAYVGSRAVHGQQPAIAAENLYRYMLACFSGCTTDKSRGVWVRVLPSPQPGTPPRLVTGQGQSLRLYADTDTQSTDAHNYQITCPVCGETCQVDRIHLAESDPTD
jgi:hypothetical protein